MVTHLLRTAWLGCTSPRLPHYFASSSSSYTPRCSTWNLLLHNDRLAKLAIRSTTFLGLSRIPHRNCYWLQTTYRWYEVGWERHMITVEKETVWNFKPRAALLWLYLETIIIRIFLLCLNALCFTQVANIHFNIWAIYCHKYTINLLSKRIKHKNRYLWCIFHHFVCRYKISKNIYTCIELFCYCDNTYCNKSVVYFYYVFYTTVYNRQYDYFTETKTWFTKLMT